MHRIATCILASAIICTTALAGGAGGEYEFHAALDLSYAQANSLKSWTEGGIGRLRQSDGAGGGLARGFVDLKSQFRPTLSGHLVLDIYSDNLGPAISPTEAYLSWRPVPKSASKYRLKAGFFYPTLSLENSGKGWSSPYTRSSSAINTWIAEEVRTFGVEGSVQRRPEWLGRAHEFVAYGGLFQGNDPAGTLLAWRGWSIHDRQSRFGDELPLPPIPFFEPGARIDHHQDHVAPFEEIDHKTGYYAGVEWRAGKRFRLRVTHYDNRGDPIAVASGQYAWDTKFDHVGVQAFLPYEFELIGQWMTGKTDMGPEVNGAYLIDNDFHAAFALLSRRFGKSRLSVRYDDFDVSDDDQIALDVNQDSGHAWTLNWQHRYSDRLSFFLETIEISGNHAARAYYDAEPHATERLFEIGMTLHLGQ